MMLTSLAIPWWVWHTKQKLAMHIREKGAGLLRFGASPCSTPAEGPGRNVSVQERHWTGAWQLATGVGRESWAYTTAAQQHLKEADRAHGGIPWCS